MHITVWLPKNVNDVEISNSALQLGLAVRPISPMCSEQYKLSGLMLGFGAFTQEQLRDGVARLSHLINKFACQHKA